METSFVRRRREAHQQRLHGHRGRRGAAIAVLAAGAMALTGSLTPASALPSDDSEALASLLDADLLGIDLVDAVRAAAGNPSGPGPATTTIDAGVLDGLVGLSVPGVSMPLVGAGGLLDLGGALDAGLLNEYASAPDAATATAASGAVNNTGAIDVSGVADPTSTDLAVVDLTELLDQAGVAGLTDAIVDQARLGLGALASTASQEAGDDPTSEYLLAGAQLSLRSPLVGTLQQAVVDSLDTALDAVVGPGGTLQTALDAVSLPGVNVLGLVTVDLGAPVLDVSVDVAGAVDDAIAALPAPGGLVGIDLDSGLITIDLAELHAGNLNGLGPNTPLLTGPEITQISNALSALLGDITDSIAQAVRTALMSTAVTISFTPAVSAIGGAVSGTVGVTVDTTLGDLLTQSVSDDDVDVVGSLTVSVFPLPDQTIDAGALADALVDPILTTLLPAAVAPLEPVLGDAGTLVETTVGGAAASVLDTLDPVLTGLLGSLIRLTVNSQSTPGVLGADSFTVRPLLVELLPGVTDTGLALAASSVRVAAEDAGTAPTITTIAPSSGPTSGGTVVTVTGTNLDGVTAVTFGGVAGTGLTVAPDGTSLTVTTPSSETAGPVDVVVTSPDGTATGAFTYVAPTVGGLSPAQGPEAGGTTVTITGTGLTGATDVTFGGVPAASFTVVDDTTVTAVTPAGTGVVDVAVTLPGADALAPDAFAYLAPGAPAVTSLVPDEGPTSGGTEVTLTGTGLDGVTDVTFGGAPATVVSNPDDTTLVVLTPPGTAGPADVVITNGAGVTGALPGGFTYVGPTVDGVSPGEGPQEGGTLVTITGSGFTGATDVTFGGVPAASFTVVDDTTITAVTPAGTGVVDVAVVLPGDDALAEDAFTYTAPPAPVASGITPASGPTSGGTTVTITGTDLDSVTEVTFGGVPGTGLTVSPDGTSLTVTTPATETPGTAVVEIASPLGDATSAFTYVAPTVGGLSPAQGPEAGGTTVTITGTGLTGATDVTFGGVPAASFTVVDDTTVTAVTPAGTGVVDVAVTLPGADALAPDAFAYLAPGAPAVDSVVPDSGPTAGGTQVTLTGQDLGGVTAVTFDGAPATVVSNPDDTTLVVLTPPGEVGPADIAITNGDGVTGVLPGGFTYLADGSDATVTGIEPTEVSTAGGTVVTITGENLAGATGVTFDGVPGTIVSADDTTIVVVAPASETAGPADVALVFPLGEADAGAVTYVGPTVGGITPSSGPLAGGTVVTLRGAGLAQAGPVLFGGVAATGLVVSADGTTLTAMTPPGQAVGPVDVTVVLPGLDAVAADGFTYVVVPTDDPSGPTITDVTPGSASTSGGTLVTVTGSGFVPGQTFIALCGALIGPSQVTVSPDGTSLTFRTPACDPGTETLTVATPVGSAATTFWYVEAVAGTGGRLASTGQDAGWLALLGLVLLLAGTGLVVRARRAG